MLACMDELCDAFEQSISSNYSQSNSNALYLFSTRKCTVSHILGASRQTYNGFDGHSPGGLDDFPSVSCLRKILHFESKLQTRVAVPAGRRLIFYHH